MQTLKLLLFLLLGLAFIPSCSGLLDRFDEEYMLLTAEYILHPDNFGLNVSDELSIIVRLLTIYNLRISEILDIEKSNIVNDSILIVRGKKHSRDIVIRDQQIIKDIVFLARARTKKIFIYSSYSFIYNFLKSNFGHLFSNLKTKKNNKITHAFRYINVANIGNIKDTALILNHNSHRSAKFYNNKLKE